MQKKAAIGTVLVLIAVIMVASSLVLPYYSQENKMTGEVGGSTVTITSGQDFYLDHVTVTIPDYDSPGNESSEDISYDDDEIKDFKFVEVFGTTQMLVFLGLVGCIVGLIGAALVAADKLKRSIGAVLVLVAVILCILAPIYLMVSLIPAFEDDGIIITSDKQTDFFGSDKSTEGGITTEHNWGGAIGWYLPIIAAVMCIIALVLVAKSKPTPQAFSIEGTIAPGMAPADQIPLFSIEPEAPAAIPMAQPVMETKPKGEEFQCPQCSKIFIVALEKRPLHIKCPYCGLEGIVE